MEAYGGASHDTSNWSQTHFQASPLIQCINSDASLDADADAPLDTRCGYSLTCLSFATTNVVPWYGEWKFTMYDESIMWTEVKSRCEVEGQRLAVLDHLDKIMNAASQT